MKKNIKKYFPLFLFLIIFVAGLLVMLYPVISNAISVNNYNHVIKDYKNVVDNGNRTKYKKMLEEASLYNSSLTSSSILDAFSYQDVENSTDYLNILNIDQSGIMGYISIPKIDVKVPIYHGTNSKVLQKGVGHLEGSSFPVGGSSTHAVLSAHRGLPSSKLFTDLDQMEKGDVFHIYILNEVFTYQVDQILVIEPSSTEPLMIQEGKDYVTLVTCTPYAVNTHRLLVRGTRVMPEEQTEKIEITKKMDSSDLILYVGLGMSLIILSITIFIVRQIIKRSMHLENRTNIENIEEVI